MIGSRSTHRAADFWGERSILKPLIWLIHFTSTMSVLMKLTVVLSAGRLAVTTRAYVPPCFIYGLVARYGRLGGCTHASRRFRYSQL